MRQKIATIDKNNDDPSLANSLKQTSCDVHERLVIPEEPDCIPSSFDNQCNAPPIFACFERLCTASVAAPSQDVLSKENEKISDRMFQVHCGSRSHDQSVPLDTFIGRGRRTSKRQRELKEQRLEDCGCFCSGPSIGSVRRRVNEVGEPCSMAPESSDRVAGQCCDAEILDHQFGFDVASIGQPSGAPPPGQRKKRPVSQASVRRPSIRRRTSTAGAHGGEQPSYQDIGDCVERCRYCDAMFWPGEQLAANEVRNRMNHFEDSDGRPLDEEIVQGLIEFLDAHNELVQLFRTARDKCADAEVPDFKVRLFNAKGSRNYELPTSDAIGAIVFDSGPTSEADYDVIIEYRDAPPKRINKLHQSYMSLQFPLIFIYGQPGYHTKLMLRSADPNEKMRRMEDTAIQTIEYPPEDKAVDGVDAVAGEETGSGEREMVGCTAGTGAGAIVKTQVPSSSALHEGTTEVSAMEDLTEPSAAFTHAATVPAQTVTPVASKDHSQKDADANDETKAQEEGLFEDKPSDMKKQRGKIKDSTNNTQAFLFHQYFTITLGKL
ncbi:helitron helicase-like domain-containing protein [Artemisia annua]|uniref:Helitron helicase-like domain-containing protein n=1 Tax=Artemisia annua TaxID=35608 RepID=A0A2U1PY24_ARTAN|nr:helitron helicase-like domain-containing protein [Artemisia annua]